MRHTLSIVIPVALGLLLPWAVLAQKPVAIEIDSSPSGATVYADAEAGEALGKTPLKQARVQKGDHVLIFKLEGHEDARLNINVARAGERFTATLTALSVLTVTAGGQTGASMRLDGDPAGAIPYRATVKPGKHLVQVGKDGFKVFSQWVDVKVGQPVTLDVKLEPLPPEMGSILVAGDVPGAPIYLDDQPKGVTPAVLDNVPPGEHTVELRPPGMPPFRQTVRVVARERANVSPSFRAAAGGASVRVIANVPEAVVSIDGEVVGQVPVTKDHLRAGDHLVSGTAKGFAEAQETVKIGDGEERVVSLRLEPVSSADGRMIVNASAPGAKVFIDGADRGGTPVVIEKPPSGMHAVIVSADGYQDMRTTCETGPGQNCEINADLQPIGAPIRVTANVEGAELFLDGQLKGPVPWEGGVPVGSHRLEVRAKGYRTHSEQVDFKPTNTRREFAVELSEGEATEVERKLTDKEFDALANAATTHTATALAPEVVALDLSVGWPYLLEGRMGIGLFEMVEAGVAMRSFFRLNEIELHAKMGYRPTRQLSVGGQVSFGGGLGPSRSAVAAEGPGAANHPVNSAFLSLEGLGTLHFSDHGAFTLWLAVDFHSDRYDWTGPDSDILSARGLARDRQDMARLRLGGALELVLDRHWNAWGQFEGILVGDSRDVLGDVYGFGSDDTQLYFRLGGTYKF